MRLQAPKCVADQTPVTANTSNEQMGLSHTSLGPPGLGVALGLGAGESARALWSYLPKPPAACGQSPAGFQS